MDIGVPKESRPGEHRVALTPWGVKVFLSEIPRLIEGGVLPVDVPLIQVSPPDEHGFCSFGVGVECAKAASRASWTRWPKARAW